MIVSFVGLGALAYTWVSGITLFKSAVQGVQDGASAIEAATGAIQTTTGAIKATTGSIEAATGAILAITKRVESVVGAVQAAVSAMKDTQELLAQSSQAPRYDNEILQRIEDIGGVHCLAIGLAVGLAIGLVLGMFIASRIWATATRSVLANEYAIDQAMPAAPLATPAAHQALTAAPLAQSDDDEASLQLFKPILDPVSMEARAARLGRAIRTLRRPCIANATSATLPVNSYYRGAVSSLLKFGNTRNVRIGGNSGDKPHQPNANDDDTPRPDVELTSGKDANMRQELPDDESSLATDDEITLNVKEFSDGDDDDETSGGDSKGDAVSKEGAYPASPVNNNLVQNVFSMLAAMPTILNKHRRLTKFLLYLFYTK